jgi:hypothetical protein
MGSALPTLTGQSEYSSQDTRVERFRAQLTSNNNGDIDEQKMRSGDIQPSQKHSRGGSKTTYVPEEIVTALQIELEQVEQKLRLCEDKYSKSKDKYRTLRTFASEEKEQREYYESEAKCLELLLNKILNKYLVPYVKKNGDGPKEWTEDTMLTILNRMFQDAMLAKSSQDQVELLHSQVKSSQDQVKSLQEQVQILQKQLLAKADKVQAASDQQFALDFRNMVSLIKTLSRTARPTEVVNTVATADVGLLLVGVSAHYWSNRPKAKCLIEACIWSVLVKQVFRTPFAFLGPACDSLSSTWQNVFCDTHFGEWPSPTALCETWRYTTIERMLNVVNLEVITKGLTKDSNPVVEPSILKAREVVLRNVQAALAEKGLAPNLTQLHTIIDKAFTLAMQMSLQRYRVQVTWPKVGDIFNEGEMSSVPSLDDSDSDEGIVAFVVNPGLTKWGDTHGGHFDQRYDVVRSLVQLESGTPTQAKQAKEGEQELLEARIFERELDEEFASKR